MRISYTWLKDYLPTLKASPQKLADALTGAGLEVEAIIEQAAPFAKIIVGAVIDKSRHPDADRLSICQVDTGDATLKVVCGAPNVAVGKKYPLALVGAILPNGLELKPTTIRGVASEGMLCSARELGLAEDGSGLMELPERSVIGQRLPQALGLNDTIFEIAVTPNRGDCLSHRGIARELSTLFKVPLRDPKTQTARGGTAGSGTARSGTARSGTTRSGASRGRASRGDFSVRGLLKVTVVDKRGCLRYCARSLKGIKIAPSPEWLQGRLRALGLRPINNVVDATNFVMLDRGHPVHAFDARFVRGGILKVCRAIDGEQFETIDHVGRTLATDDLVIADCEGPMALAGIMGGVGSEVREDTTELILEVACFEAARIRRTAKRLGLATDSSMRFERGVPLSSVPATMQQLTVLILDLAGGVASRDIVDVMPVKKLVQDISLSKTKLASLLGITIPSAEVVRIFKALGLEPKSNQSGWKVRCPDSRPDLTRDVDLIEELIRIRGLDHIPSVLPQQVMRPVHKSRHEVLADPVRDFFVGRGFFETIHYSFIDPKLLEKCLIGAAEGLPLANPLSEDLSVMRPSLLPQLLADATRQESARDFELRPVFNPKGAGEWRLTLLWSGPLIARSWQSNPDRVDFYAVKGLMEDLSTRLRIHDIQWRTPTQSGLLHPMQAVDVCLQDQVLASLGAVHPVILQNFGLGQGYYALDLHYNLLVQGVRPGSCSFQSLSPYPQVQRDLSITCDHTLEYSKIIKEINELSNELLSRVELFDVYSGGGIPEGRRGLGLSLIYASPDRTLTDQEVNQAYFALVEHLRDKLGIELRA